MAINITDGFIKAQLLDKVSDLCRVVAYQQLLKNLRA